MEDWLLVHRKLSTVDLPAVFLKAGWAMCLEEEHRPQGPHTWTLTYPWAESCQLGLPRAGAPWAPWHSACALYSPCPSSGLPSGTVSSCGSSWGQPWGAGGPAVGAALGCWGPAVAWHWFLPFSFLCHFLLVPPEDSACSGCNKHWACTWWVCVLWPTLPTIGPTKTTDTPAPAEQAWRGGGAVRLSLLIGW